VNKQRKWGGVATWILWGLLAVVVVATGVLMAIRRPPEPAVEVVARSVPVRTLTLAARVLPDVVRTPAKIEAGGDVVISVERAGRVAEVPVDKGDTVKAGQLLLRLDGEVIAVARKRLEIEKREAEKALARWTELKKTGAVADSEMDGLRQRLDMADAALAEADVHLGRCDVKSPIAGLIEDRRLDAGEYAHEGDPAFRIVDAGEVKLTFRTSERDIGYVKPGLAVPFRILTMPAESFTGRVTFVSAAAGREDNAFPVEARVPNADGRLRPGMIAEATLIRRADAQVLVVPLAAVIPEKGEHVVYVVEEGHAARRIVRIAGQTESEAVIGTGLRAGDRVVVEGQRGLQDGAKVTENDRAGATAPGNPLGS